MIHTKSSMSHTVLLRPAAMAGVTRRVLCQRRRKNVPGSRWQLVPVVHGRDPRAGRRAFRAAGVDPRAGGERPPRAGRLSIIPLPLTSNPVSLQCLWEGSTRETRLKPLVPLPK